MIRDVAFWLTQSSGKVNVVLTVNLHTRGRISIEQWKMGGRAPVPVQRLEITRKPAPKCEKVRGSMRIPFDEIHLRPKGPRDTDFVVSHQDLEEMADQVWRKQAQEDQRRESR